jgi:hypothetical protein
MIKKIKLHYKKDGNLTGLLVVLFVTVHKIKLFVNHMRIT